jgi:hypothetical protein
MRGNVETRLKKLDAGEFDADSGRGRADAARF